MNDRYDAGYGGDQYELVGYDEFGQPVYRQVPTQHSPQGATQGYDPYGTHPQQQPQGYGYDPYATGGQQAPASYDTGRQQPVASYDTSQQPSAFNDPYGSSPADGAAGAGSGYDRYDPYGQAAGTGQQSRAAGQQPHAADQTAYIPHQAGPTGAPQGSGAARPGDGAAGAQATDGRPQNRPVDPSGEQAGDRDSYGDERDYRTEQFAFVEEPDGNSEDVIDWLKFTENRTERREEARRRARSRIVALVVTFALVAVGGVGYLWYAGKLPGTLSEDKANTTTAAGAQKRDVLVVHLHNTAKGGTSTALLVNNTTTKRGATVLLPNSLALTDDDGNTTTLAKSVEDDGSSGTRDALDTVLGTNIEGSWRLDTPYLNNLVELVGNIDVDTNAAVPDPEAKKKGEAPLVAKGKAQTLSGKMAVAYATYRAPGESQNAQLQRFGQVMQGVLRKLSSDPQAATTTVQTLAQILDPPLTDNDLGTFLAGLADRAKGGDYETDLLPVQQDGILSTQASDSVVKDVLGGTAKSPDAGDAVRVGIRNATGSKDATEQARVVLLNGGYTFLDAGTDSAAQAASQVTYADSASKNDAVEVAKTLGLPADSVKKGKTTSNADVSVVLGQNYKATTSGSSG
ncbi:LCP family protein [Streptomyces spongiae]|uniref:LytR family transcriptional regulator n=1 Tax=Streptomyces spongiae TaxID=565072 RepID=A0A5N8XLW1_9ACTN|nr:LytR C-terminal domain-containing protein [Streptomyces spongiae]MPY60422.1 LytR family transcriptional regulator [Streptomyces spongiae]